MLPTLLEPRFRGRSPGGGPSPSSSRRLEAVALCRPGVVMPVFESEGKQVARAENASAAASTRPHLRPSSCFSDLIRVSRVGQALMCLGLMVSSGFRIVSKSSAEDSLSSFLRLKRYGKLGQGFDGEESSSNQKATAVLVPVSNASRDPQGGMAQIPQATMGSGTQIQPRQDDKCESEVRLKGLPCRCDENADSPLRRDDTLFARKDEWQLAHEVNCARAKQSVDADVVWFGDSITESWTGNSLGRPRKEWAPIAETWSHLFGSSEQKLKFVSLGISGDQTQVCPRIRVPISV